MSNFSDQRFVPGRESSTRGPLTCDHPGRKRYGTTGVCFPCYSTRIWRGQSKAKDGAWAAYRKALKTQGYTNTGRRA